jgi:hypothetical protein
MGGGRVQIEVILFDVFAVISLGTGETEKAFLYDRVFAVPKSQSEAHVLFVIRDAGQAVFPPSVCPRAGVIMGKIVPGVSAVAVVFADRAPLAFG